MFLRACRLFATTVKFRPMKPLRFLLACVCFAIALPCRAETRHLLYVASPGIRDYLEYGGHGILVYDMDHEHRFLKRIASAGVDAKGKPRNVKGICVSIPLHRVYVTTPEVMMAIDLLTEKLVWEKHYDRGCDRMAITPDGKTIYVPSFESDNWKAVDASSGEVLHTIVTKSGSHNTICGADG